MLNIGLGSGPEVRVSAGSNSVAKYSCMSLDSGDPAAV